VAPIPSPFSDPHLRPELRLSCALRFGRQGKTMNVGPKDLALVVAPNSFASATCIVIERADDFPDLGNLLERFGPLWVVRFPRPMQWDVVVPGADPTLGAIPDVHLRRLTGPGIAVNHWTGRGVKVPG
jgi:hypothetical protein